MSDATPPLLEKLETAPPYADKPQMLASPEFSAWLTANDVCVALTTYQAGRLFLIGRGEGERLRAHERKVDRCQGMWTDGKTIWVSSKSILWRFENDLAGDPTSRLFAPREGRVTGKIDIHDIATTTIDGRRAPIFVSTAYNCLATISDTASFRPLWRPPFISAIVGEDRCHLNGLAMDGERPAFVTAVSRSDIADGWRDRRDSGGVVLDVASGEVVVSGLSMPHSPRLYRGELWVLNSGTGEFGRVDMAGGRFEPVAFVPGFSRGLAFVGDHAVIGLSRPRRNATFEGLALQGALEAKDTPPRCGLVVIDLRSGRTTEWLRFEPHSTIEELYDVAVLPGVARAEAIGFLGDAIETSVSIENVDAPPLWSA